MVKTKVGYFYLSNETNEPLTGLIMETLKENATNK